MRALPVLSTALLIVPICALAQSAAKDAKPAAEAPAAKPSAPPPAALVSARPKTRAKTKKAEPKASPDGREPRRGRAASPSGPIGLDRAWSADTGAEQTFRLRLGLGFFSAEDWPSDGSSNDFLETEFALVYTAHKFVETWLGVHSTSNTNKGSQPQLLQTQGDVTLGVKGGAYITESVALGGAVGVHLLSGLGEGGFAGDGTSAEFRALATFDLERAKIAPVRILFNYTYYLENSEAVYADEPVEPDLVQEWGLQVARYNRSIITLGVEGIIDPYATLFLEYRIGTPHLVELERKGRDSNDFEFGSVPHSIAPGARGFVTEDLALEVIGRFGLSDKPFTGVKATPPWEMLFGLSYTLDPRPKIVEREVKAEAPKAPVLNNIVGTVVDSKSGRPIKGARISYPGRGLSAQVTASGGNFGGYQFPLGPVEILVEAEGYEPGRATITLDKPGQYKHAAKLKARKGGPMGTLEVRVFDSSGKAMGATVEVAGKKGSTTADAPFLQKLPAGTHKLKVRTTGFGTVQRKVEVRSKQTLSLSLALQKADGKGKVRKRLGPSGGGRSAPVGGRRSLVRLGAKAFVLKRPIKFTGNTAKLTAGSKKVLDQMADLLNENPQVKKLRIKAHTDNRGNAGKKKALSTERAKAVRSHLVSKGVSSRRLGAKGYGGARPVAPNLTKRGRDKNNRVEFTITELE